MNLLDHLQQDHQSVRDQITLFQQTLNSLKTQWEHFLAHLDYFEAALENHLTLEETDLFPAIAPYLPPQGPVQVMLKEHERLRELMVAMRELSKKEPQNHDQIKTTADEFTVLLLNHILKEDRVLFPMSQAIFMKTGQTGFQNANQL